MTIDIETLRLKVIGTLKKSFGLREARIIADYLIWAEMSGNKTQGLIKLLGTEPLQNIKPDGKILVERNTKLSQIIDAKKNPAILAASIGVQTAIKKAKKHGFAIIGVRNTFSSNGAQAYYVEKIAKEDLIGIMCSRSPSSTTGFDSIDPLFGTNPIGFAFPTSDAPIVFDMATSAMTFYGLILAKMRGEKIPDNIAIDAGGKSTNNPADAMDGALFTFDRSYKSAGLGMVIEILAGPLVGGAFIDNRTFKEEWGSLIIAIDPNLLVDVSKFKNSCSELVERIKTSRKKENINEIRLPGEQSRKKYEQCRASGLVDVEESILRELKYI